MFAKLFAQIFDSSIAEDYLTRHVFMDMIVLADSEGVVDITPDAIARRTNVPEEIVLQAIVRLCQPDPKSRSKDEDGRRLLLLDSHRDWGWSIVNYEHYRSVRDEESRRNYFRDKKREQRAGTTNRKRGYVYYVESEIGIKIGFSSNPWARLNELLTASPSAKLLAVEGGDMSVEKLRHEQFKEHRIEREWFKKHPSLLSHVATIATSTFVPTTATTSTHAEAEAEAEGKKKRPRNAPVTQEPDSGSELALACRILEELAVPADNGCRRMAAESIRLLAREGGTKKDAADYILAAARRAKVDGETINRFWFTDQKYQPQQETGNGRSGKGKRGVTGERLRGTRLALVEALAKRGVDVFGDSARTDSAPVSEPGERGNDRGVPDGFRAVGGEVLPPES